LIMVLGLGSIEKRTVPKPRLLEPQRPYIEEILRHFLYMSNYSGSRPLLG
jgi:hypothetical protein